MGAAIGIQFLQLLLGNGTVQQANVEYFIGIADGQRLDHGLKRLYVVLIETDEQVDHVIFHMYLVFRMGTYGTLAPRRFSRLSASSLTSSIKTAVRGMKKMMPGMPNSLPPIMAAIRV